MEKVPRHVGIIMDGNRRFAKKLLMKPWMGHEWGAKKIHSILDWSRELGIKEITFYAFSVQNFDRPKQEFDYLMDIFCKEFDGLMDAEKQKELAEKGIRLNFIGRLRKFPEKVYTKMKKLMEMTADNKGYDVNFAMAYGGREEVIDAVQKIALQVQKGELDVKSINENVFADNLYLNSDPDLVIRTGGERRTSNFLTWQSTYSELLFIDKTWPELEKEDYLMAIQEYSNRDRRFGK
ncbi:di-trans,poly-cis-decaprenylcistransferase [Candidatus Woesearchaeota archaeon]|nr:di-trans,poly-cis-decaprenylcistransferase [Candidatus Woesearchaeota archaeon]